MAHIRACTAKSQFMVCTVCLAVAVLSILFSATCFGKTVTIDVDGEQKQVFVYANNVQEVLKIADIDLIEEDEISANLYDEVFHGQILYINKAIPVQFEVKGENTEFYTTA